MKMRFFCGVFAAIVLLLPALSWAQHGGHGARGHGRSRGEGTGRAAVVIAPVAPRAVFARPVFARPYYAFQPRTRVGFGLFLGYPVAYPHFYAYPNYVNAYPSPYPYYPYSYASPTMVYPYAYPYTSVLPTYSTTIPVYGRSPSPLPSPSPSTAAIGGVGFEISPGEAAVFVDGVYVGTANDFSASVPPLSLPAGRHHFELRALGYQTMSFDVDVIAGQVIPYQGTLQPAP
jgi:hypothetical protein